MLVKRDAPVWPRLFERRALSRYSISLAGKLIEGVKLLIDVAGEFEGIGSVKHGAQR